MGNSSGDICYLSRQSIKRRRRFDDEAGTACVGIGRFLESTNINQVLAKSSPLPGPCPLTTRGSRASCRHGGGTHARTYIRTREITATITCLEDTKGVAPVGRATGAWRRVPRQFATRPNDHLSSGRIVSAMTLDSPCHSPRTPLCRSRGSRTRISVSNRANGS